MNRRHFFGMTLGALAAAGLPAILMPERTVFLPPKNGWHPHALAGMYMREVEQYDINSDCMHFRYDAVGRDIWGGEQQFHVDMKNLPDEARRFELARMVIGNRFQADGLAAVPIGQSKQFTLRIPTGFAHGRYI